MKMQSQNSLIEDFQKVHGSKFDYSLVEYKGCSVKISIICNSCGNIFNSKPYNHKNGSGCPYCKGKNISNAKTKTLESFLLKQKEIHGYKYEYIDGYQNRRSKIRLKCIECGEIFIQEARSHIDSKHGCPSCAIKRVAKEKCKDIETFEKQCSEKHLGRYRYFQDYVECREKIKIECITCNNVFYQTASSHLYQLCGCPECNFSKGELEISKILKFYNISYCSQKSFDGCRNIEKLIFDFYLPEYNICIEYDGEQHFTWLKGYISIDKFERTKENDSIKDNYCLENNIKLIRIHYKDYKNIKIILNTEIMEKYICLDLNQVLTLSTVN